MFSLIKKLQALLSKLKKNKGLWFTAITTVSIIGIILFMYMILTMTGGVKEKVYQAESKKYKTKLNIILNNKRELFKEISKAFMINNNLLTAIEKNKKNKLIQITKKINQKYKKKDFQSIIVNFFPIKDTKSVLRNTIALVLRSKSEVFGIEVQPDGVFITLITPIMKNGNFIGLTEIKQSIHSLKKDFLDSNQKFLFLLDKKMLIKISLKAKSGRYKDVVKNYIVYYGAYSSRFYSKIKENGEDIFSAELKKGYGADGAYYRTYKKTTDINGADIGLFVLGERVEENEGFVNIANNIIKTVAMTSLGLVVSIMLFMF